MLVSVIIPAFNRERLVREALASVLQQRWRPVEIILVDDGSTDGTVKVAEAFVLEARDAGVDLRIISGPNRGSTAARNTGIAAARGECLLFLDSDDVLTRDGLSSLVEALQAEGDTDFAYGRVAIGDENLKPTGALVGKTADDLLEDPFNYHWHTMAALYRSSLILASGGWDQTANGSDDWVFQSRVKFAAKQARFVDVEVGIWREHLDDRLGTTRFRESYTVDVTKACAAIHRHWSGAGRMTSHIHRRLYLRALRHCWELGAFGSRTERSAAFGRLNEIAVGSKVLGVVAYCFEKAPALIDHCLYKLVSRSRG